jgi:hypothetical protein
MYIGGEKSECEREREREIMMINTTLDSEAKLQFAVRFVAGTFK